jgi:uncharacterized membrane protein YbhN (UPF0104 family)
MQSSKKIGFLIKLLIILLTFWFLYQKVFVDKTFNDLSKWFVDTLKNKSPLPLFVVLFLMLLNWFVESLKWKYLINKLETVSVWLSFKAIFLGITVSIFTPNRIGEFGGRIFCLTNADRIKAVISTMLGNLSQLLATVLFGCLAICYFLFNFNNLLGFDYTSIRLLLLLLNVFLFFGSLFLYLNASYLTIVLNKIPFLKKYIDYLKVFSYYSRKELLNILFFSMFRYSIFTFQFYLLLHFFDVEVSFTSSAAMSALTFFTMSIIPTIAITELFARGSVAILFYGLLSDNLIGITMAASSLWAINLVLPAIIGVFFVFNLKFFRS